MGPEWVVLDVGMLLLLGGDSYDGAVYCLIRPRGMSTAVRRQRFYFLMGSPMSVRLLVVDDHEVIRTGLKSLLAGSDIIGGGGGCDRQRGD